MSRYLLSNINNKQRGILKTSCMTDVTMTTHGDNIILAGKGFLYAATRREHDSMGDIVMVK